MPKIRMQIEKSFYETIGFITNNINNLGMSLELVDRVDYELENDKMSFLVYEKFYYRNNSYASLSILINGNDQHSNVDAISSGGGSGFLNISWGAEKSFINKFKSYLEKEGFREVQ